MWVVPSLAVASPLRTTVGSTLAMATVWRVGVAVGAVAVLDLTVTVLEAGPSGNEQSKLPAPVAVLKVSAPTWVPLGPQSVASSTNVSAPGSLTVKL